MLGPCSNAMTPYEGPQTIDWLLEGEFDFSSGSIRQLVSKVLNCKDLKSRFSVPHLSTIMQECRRPFAAKMFHALYRKISCHLKSCYGLNNPHRIPIHIPVPDQNMSLAIKQDLAKMLSGSENPQPANCVARFVYYHMPQRTAKGSALMRGANPLQATHIAAEHIRKLKGTPFVRRRTELGTLSKTLPHVIHQMPRKETHGEIMRHCDSEQIKQEHPSPAGNLLSLGPLAIGCAALGCGAEPPPPQFWGLSIWLEPGLSRVTWVHYDATMCFACLVRSVLPVWHFLRFGRVVL